MLAACTQAHGQCAGGVVIQGRREAGQDRAEFFPQRRKWGKGVWHRPRRSPSGGSCCGWPGGGPASPTASTPQRAVAKQALSLFSQVWRRISAVASAWRGAKRAATPASQRLKASIGGHTAQLPQAPWRQAGRFRSRGRQVESAGEVQALLQGAQLIASDHEPVHQLRQLSSGTVTCAALPRVLLHACSRARGSQQPGR
jgi:hypothetical protein